MAGSAWLAGPENELGKKVGVMNRIACNGIGIVLSLGLLGLPAAAQNQPSSSSSESLGDYARQVRKTPGSSGKAKVFDNDNLPRQNSLSIVGPPPTASTENSGEAKPAESSNAAPAAGEIKGAGEAKASGEVKPPESKTAEEKAPAKSEGKSTDEKVPPKVTPKTSEEEDAAKQVAMKQWEDKLAAQKQEIELLTRELDVLQREYQIRAAAMYADAGNRMRNAADWDKQDAQYKQQIADKQKALEEAKQKLDDMQEEARKAGVPGSARE
jgi:hypothetical protein